MERPEHPIPGAVTGEDPARSIRSVGCGRKAEHEDACIGITEPRYPASPVRFVSVRGTLVLCNLLAPIHEAGTPAAGSDVVGKSFE